MQLYEPREDSELLAKHVNEHAKGICLDVGTGSGIQAVEAAKNKNVKKRKNKPDILAGKPKTS